MPAGGYQGWEDARSRRARRSLAVRSLLFGASTVAMPLVLWVNLALGPASVLRYSYVASEIALGAAVVLPLSALLLPARVMRAFEYSALAAVRVVTAPIVSLLVLLFYMLTFPFAVTFGRRRLVADHPAIAAWLPASRADWKAGPSWVPKDGTPPRFSERRPSREIVFYFASRGNWFLLVAALLAVLVSGLVAMAAPSSPLAPLIYTLF